MQSSLEFTMSLSFMPTGLEQDADISALWVSVLPITAFTEK